MNINNEDEEEQRPLTTADIRALLDEQEERINAKHKEEIRLQSDEQDARHKEEIRLQEERINAAHQEEMRAHKEEMRLLEEATDRRFKDLEQASVSSPPPQDTANNNAGATQTNDEILPLTNNQCSSNTQLAPNRPRRGNTAMLSFLLFRKERNAGSSGNGDEAGDDDDSSEALEEDTFSLMMLNKPCREIPSFHPTLLMTIPLVASLGLIFLFFGVIYVQNVTLHWFLLAASAVMIFGPLSPPWLLSVFTFLCLQLILGLLIIFDQTRNQSVLLGCHFYGTCVPFHVPLGTTPGLTVAQYLAVFIALAMQYDIFSSLQTLVKLWNADNVPWDEVIGQPGNRTRGLWICRILLPNIFKLIQAAEILYATFIVIIQSTRVVELLKDFTALFVLTQADNIMFQVASLGYFGENLKKKTEEVRAARWMIVQDAKEEDEEDKPRCRCSCKMGGPIFFTLAMAMIGGLTYVVVGQYNGKFLKIKYRFCDVPYPSLIGDGYCSDFPPYNTAECGWDGGDCPEHSGVAGECDVPYPSWISDGFCDEYLPYNTAECGWDGGDCPEPFDGTPPTPPYLNSTGFWDD